MQVPLQFAWHLRRSLIGCHQPNDEWPRIPKSKPVHKFHKQRPYSSCQGEGCLEMIKRGKETEIKNDSTSVSERQVGMCPSLATGHWGSPVFGGLALLMQQIRGFR